MARIAGADRTGARAQVSRTIAARACTMPVAAVAALLTVRVIVAAVGSGGYAVAALVATLPALLPASDLGVGAAITTAVAIDSEPDEQRRVLVSSVRVLLGFAFVLVFVSLALASLSAWSMLLGLPHSLTVEWSVGLSISLFALSLPLGIGARVLLAVGQNHVAVLLQGMVYPLVLVICLIGWATRSGLWLFAAAPAVATLLLGVACCWQADARSRVELRRVLSDAFRRDVHGAKIRHLAGPMAVISASLPVAYQSDRLILSHVTTVETLAIYSAGAALFAPLLAIVGSGGQSLWPLFARTARDNTRERLRIQYLHARWAFSGLGVALAVGLIVLGPPVATWAVRSEVVVPISLMASFGVLLVVHAAYYPTGMLLTDAAGLRLQAVSSALMAALNVGLSIALAHVLGAPGPVIGSALAIVVCMWLPGMTAARARLSGAGLRVGAA